MLEVVDGVLASLKSRLPAMLAAEGLPAVREFLAWEPTPPAPAQAPQVWVEVEAARPGGPARFGSPGGAESHLLELRVGLSSAGPNAAEATARLYRMATLARAAVLADRTAGGTVADLRWRGTEWVAGPAGALPHLIRLAHLRFEGTLWRSPGED